MNRKANRRFAVLIFTLVALGVIGTTAAVMLTTEANLVQYDIRSPTALPNADALTAWAKRLTQTASSLPTPTLPYEPTLYALRRTEAYHIMASLGPSEWAVFSATETALVATYQGTVLPTPTGSATPIEYMECAWMWARQDLPVVAALAQAALQAGGIADVRVRAEAFGENCLDGQTMQINNFAAMTTDFYLTIPAENLDDADDLSETLIRAFTVINTLPQETWPAQPGYFDVTFTWQNESRRVRAMFAEVKRALKQNLKGAALLQALGTDE